ncbi:MAG: hypothetical protein ACE5HI_14215 [bacterium]
MSPNISINLPRWFRDDLNAIDKRFKLVWHPWRMIWDDVMNKDTGPLDDPRFNIRWDDSYGCEVWGFVLKGLDDNPIPENRWHLWRFTPDYGWSHIIDIKSKDPKHLQTIIKILWQKAVARDKGWKHANSESRQHQVEEHEKPISEYNDKFKWVQEQNRDFIQKAYENFAMGRTRPTAPQKEIITSYSGQSNKSKIIRGLTDTEAGLVTMDDV